MNTLKINNFLKYSSQKKYKKIVSKSQVSKINQDPIEIFVLKKTLTFGVRYK